MNERREMARKLGNCTKCGESFERAAIFAMMAQFGGAQLSWNPAECPDGEEHDFEWIEIEEREGTAQR